MTTPTLAEIAEANCSASLEGGILTLENGQDVNLLELMERCAALERAIRREDFATVVRVLSRAGVQA